MSKTFKIQSKPSGRNYIAVSCQTSTSSRIFQRFKEFFPMQLINPHQIHLQILHLPYAMRSSFNTYHYHHHHHPYLHPLNILLTQNVEELFRDDQVSLHPAELNFLLIYLPSTFIQTTHFYPDLESLACLHGSVSRQRLDSLLYVCNLEDRTSGGSKLMFLPLHLYGWGIFQKHILQLIHIYINST